MSLDMIVDRLLIDGWSVYLEAIPGEGCMIGVTKTRGLGIEGVQYCDFIGSGNTFHEAFANLMNDRRIYISVEGIERITSSEEAPHDN